MNQTQLTNNRICINIPQDSTINSLSINPLHQSSPQQQNTTYNSPSQNTNATNNHQTHPRNHDKPESSTSHHHNNHHTHTPQFSYYPEQIIEEGIKACQRSVLGKIVTDKPIHISSIQNGLDSIWGSPAGIKIQEIEGKILQFCMDNEVVQERII
jgi:hypothetical protein